MHSLNKQKIQALALRAIMVMVLSGCTVSHTLSTTSEQSAVSEEEAQKATFNVPVRVGEFEIFDPKVLNILDVSAKIRTLATGFEWVEGPVWSIVDQALLFSDIPTHKVYRYKDGQGVSEFIPHSGFSNGLLINEQNELVLMQSRSRQIAKWRGSVFIHTDGQADSTVPLTSQKSIEPERTFPADNFITLANNYQGQMLNSPNDGVLSSSGHAKGTLYFTDPPYGLPKQLDDLAKELDFQGVYALSPKGELTLLDKTLVYPNGIALSPDEKTLYVAASNPNKPAWYAYSIDDEGRVYNRKTFHQAPAQSDASHGLPDGLKVHRSGVVFATGPGGIWLFDPLGTLLAKVHMPSISANLAFNADQTRVFVTAHNQLLSFSLKP